MLVNQNSLLPFARCFVGAVDAARPAAGATLSLAQFLAGSLDAALAGYGLFCILNPANKLIAAKRCKALPKRENSGVCLQGHLQVVLCLVNGTVKKVIGHCHRV